MTTGTEPYISRRSYRRLNDAAIPSAKLLLVMQRVLSGITGLYPVWLMGCATLALLHPPLFTWFTGGWITTALGIVMLGMGLTLTTGDFARLLRAPGSLALGFLAHYSIMPLTGWLVGRVVGLEPGLAVGLILVASCPSGTASNVVSYLAKVDVALAVSVTLTSTLLAFVMTPFWCRLLAGHYVPVDALALCLSTLKVVVMPVLLGVLCNWKFPSLVKKVAPVGPAISVIAVVLITAGIVSQNAPAVLANAGKLAIATFLLHTIGFCLGYGVSRILRYPRTTARTVAIEVGMQNGGMAAMLAKKHFPMEPLAAVPAVFSGVIQNLVGSIVAARWSRSPVPLDPATGSDKGSTE
ncbi:MAG: bile acid:sodium symporter family protein [Verrucomicrobiota bacterium]